MYARADLLGCRIFTTLELHAEQSRRCALASSVTALAATLIIATAQQPFITSAHETSLERQQAATALLAHVVDNEAFERIFPDKKVAASDVAASLLAQAREMQAEGLSVFGERWASWLGTPLNTHAEIISSDRCVGSLDVKIAIPTQANPASRLRGWAWDRTAGTVPLVILLTDTSGIVVGYALPGYERPDVKTQLPQLNGRTGWQGHVSKRDLEIRAYVLLRSQKEACLLPSSSR